MPLQSPLPLSVALAAALLCGACAQPAAPGAAAVAPAPSPVAATSAAASGRTVVPLKNPSFDPDATGRMVGWSRIEHARGKSYYFVADPENAHSAPASARITRHGPEFFGALDQRIKADPAWIGKTARLSGYLKTQGATGVGGALTLQITDGRGNTLVHNYMDNRRVRGDQGWKHYSVEVKLPPQTYYVNVGPMLEEDGTLWADDMVLEILD